MLKLFFFVSTKGGVGTEPDVPQSSTAHPLLQTPEVRVSIKTANKNRSGNFTTAESSSKSNIHCKRMNIMLLLPVSQTDPRENEPKLEKATCFSFFPPN